MAARGGGGQEIPEPVELYHNIKIIEKEGYSLSIY